VSRGRRLHGDQRTAGARSFDDRGVPQAPRAALAELFTGVLGLCKQAGLVEVGVIAIDGTKIAANARSMPIAATRQSREILKEAAETDRREDELYGSARGDELPEQLRTREGRRAALREAKRRLDEGQRSWSRERLRKSLSTR